MRLASYRRYASSVSAFDFGLLAASIAFVAFSALSAEAPPWQPTPTAQARRAVSATGSGIAKQKSRRVARGVLSRGA